jgi:hypothetical protein
LVRIDKDISRIVKQLYELVNELETLYPHRRFTLDGHLVGSIGEILAAYQFDLDLLPHSSAGHDAVSREGKNVEIKVTQRKSIGLRSKPDHLLVLKLNPDGNADVVFNGPGELAWNQAGKMQKNGQKAISLSKLTLIMDNLDEKCKLKPIDHHSH